MQEKYFQYIYLQKYKVNFKKHNVNQKSLLGSSFHSLEKPLGFNVSLLRVQHLSKSLECHHVQSYNVKCHHFVQRKMSSLSCKNTKTFQLTTVNPSSVGQNCLVVVAPDFSWVVLIVSEPFTSCARHWNIRRIFSHT